jgi:hypothetical protein
MIRYGYEQRRFIASSIATKHAGFRSRADDIWFLASGGVCRGRDGTYTDWPKFGCAFGVCDECCDDVRRPSTAACWKCGIYTGL